MIKSHGHRLAENVRRFAPLAATVMLTRGLSIVTIPIVSRYLTPADYGRLELIASTLEIVGLLLSFGLADTLFRFCADTDEHGRRKAAADLLGTALLATVVFGALLQLVSVVLPVLMPAIGDGATVRLGLFAASLTGLIELPLAWLRFRGRLTRFFSFMALRSLAQATALVLMARAGYGVDGIIAANVAIDVLIALGLVAGQIRDTGVRFDPAVFRRAFGYSAPLAGGALAMFVLGTCDRWFLANSVDVSELAFYGLAAKLSLGVSLALQPFGMFWYARRLAVFHEPYGLERSAAAVSLGFVVLTCGALTVAVAGSMFISFALPASFARASVFLPWVVAIAFLNEACSLVNVGSYLGHRTLAVMAINAAGAATALLGYILLVPQHGVAGAIAATLAGQATRLVAFLLNGRNRAPIPYPFPAIAGIAALAFGAFVIAPTASSVAALAWLMLALSAIGVIALRLGMFSAVGLGAVSHAQP